MKLIVKVLTTISLAMLSIQAAYSCTTTSWGGLKDCEIQRVGCGYGTTECFIGIVGFNQHNTCATEEKIRYDTSQTGGEEIHALAMMAHAKNALITVTYNCGTISSLPAALPSLISVQE